MLTAAAMAQALGGRREGGHFMARCPAHADRTPSLAIKDAHGRVLLHCHGGCSQAAVIAALQARGLWERLDSTVPPAQNPAQYRAIEQPDKADERNLDRALDLWLAAVDPRGTLAERYLRGRELELPEDASRVLRFHPRCPLRGAWYPALIALFTAIDGDEPRGIHRIALNPDPEAGPDLAVRDADGKALKMMLGPVGSAAVKLDPDENVTYGLSIAEGIETALAVRAWGWKPIWALGSAGAIQRFPVLNGIDALTVHADNDVRGTGLKAAKACQQRWCEAGRQCLTPMPRAKGVDWADEWGAR